MFLKYVAVVLIISGGCIGIEAKAREWKKEYLVLKQGGVKRFSRLILEEPKKVKLSQEEVSSLKERGFLVEENQKFQLPQYRHSQMRNKETSIWPLAMIQADRAHELPGGQGEGVRICLITTGIDQNRSNLQGVMLEGRNFIAGGDSEDLGDSLSNYGSDLAQVLVARPQGQTVGVAPAAKVIIAKVFDETGATDLSTVYSALGYCMNRSDIVTMGFGGGLDSAIMTSILKDLKGRGISLFAAAGNDGGKLQYPARDSSVMAVGVVDQSGKVPVFSARDSRLGFVAPGYRLPVLDKEGKFSEVSGSSFAVAMAAGVEAIRRSRGAARLEYRNLSLPQETQGAGLIDALLTAVSF